MDFFLRFPLCCKGLGGPLEQVKAFCVFQLTAPLPRLSVPCSRAYGDYTVPCYLLPWVLLTPTSLSWWFYDSDVQHQMYQPRAQTVVGQLSFGLFQSFYSLCATQEQQFWQEPESRFQCLKKKKTKSVDLSRRNSTSSLKLVSLLRVAKYCPL